MAYLYGVGYARCHQRDRGKGRKTLSALRACPTLPFVRANAQDLDDYKWRGTAYWWYSQPSGFFNSAGETGRIDLQKDFSFGYYSTFSGGLDWHFKRKHHLLFGISPVSQSHTVTLARTITYQGETYNVQTRGHRRISKALSFAPGYQWDFIHRDRGYLVAVQLYMLDTEGSVTGTVVVNGQPVSELVCIVLRSAPGTRSSHALVSAGFRSPGAGRIRAGNVFRGLRRLHFHAWRCLCRSSPPLDDQRRLPVGNSAQHPRRQQSARHSPHTERTGSWHQGIVGGPKRAGPDTRYSIGKKEAVSSVSR